MEEKETEVQDAGRVASTSLGHRALNVMMKIHWGISDEMKVKRNMDSEKYGDPLSCPFCRLTFGEELLDHLEANHAPPRTSSREVRMTCNDCPFSVPGDQTKRIAEHFRKFSHGITSGYVKFHWDTFIQLEEERIRTILEGYRTSSLFGLSKNASQKLRNKETTEKQSENSCDRIIEQRIDGMPTQELDETHQADSFSLKTEAITDHCISHNTSTNNQMPSEPERESEIEANQSNPDAYEMEVTKQELITSPSEDIQMQNDLPEIMKEPEQERANKNGEARKPETLESRGISSESMPSSSSDQKLDAKLSKEEHFSSTTAQSTSLEMNKLDINIIKHASEILARKAQVKSGVKKNELTRQEDNSLDKSLTHEDLLDESNLDMSDSELPPLNAQSLLALQRLSESEKVIRTENKKPKRRKPWERPAKLIRAIGEPNFSCPYCEEKFSTAYQLNRHSSYRHKEEELPLLKRMACSACEKRFETRYKLRRHFVSSHMTKDQKKALRERTLEDKNPDFSFLINRCQFCDTYFDAPSSLDYHILKEHKSEERAICSDCGKEHILKKDLARHLRRSSNSCGKK